MIGELISQLTSTLNVNEGQAKGGAGLIFNLVKDNLGDQFTKVTEAIGDTSELEQAAPKAEGGGAMDLLGGIASKLGAGNLGTLASLASGFKALNIDTSTAAKFLPVVMEFVQSKGGDTIKTLVESALSKK